MNVLVTGGAGFIGSHLVEHLLREGHAVTVVDNLSHGRPEYIKPLEANPSFDFLLGDITDSAFLNRSVLPLKPQIVYHLAAIPYIPECEENPTRAVRVNVLGTQRILDAILSPELEQAIFVSSGEVYTPCDRPLTEQDPVGRTGIYGISKWMGEQLWRVASQDTPKCSWIVARLFNTYGPQHTNPHLIPHILQELKAGSTLRLGNLSARRDFMYVEDAVAALLKLAGLSCGFETFNVGTGSAVSVQEVVRTLEQLLGKSLDILQEDKRLRAIDRPYLCADTTKLSRATGWHPVWSLRQGLQALLQQEEISAGGIQG